MVTALTRKLGRDLVAQAGQAATITAVIACGIAGYVSMRGCWLSLERARDEYYEESRFGDAFVHLRGAPRSVAGRLEEIDGVAQVEARLVEPIRVPVRVGEDPPAGWAISLPDDGQPRLDAIRIRAGRPFDATHLDEAVVLASYAEARDLQPGDPLSIVLEGRVRDLRIVGLADSPEFSWPVSPGELMPDPARLVVVWLPERALASMIRATGTFDDAVLAIEPGAGADRVLEGVDRALAGWGGGGAYLREDQTSSRFLDQEMLQLRALALTIPVVFLGIAGFLLQIVMARLVQLQRMQIAMLKAFGYTRGEIGRHYLGLAGLIGLGGTALGLGLGVWLGRGMVGLYAAFFHLPQLGFRLEPELVLVSAVVGIGAAVAGALGTVRSVAAMPPAEAMQPAAPPSYTRGRAERAGVLKPLSPVARMVVRDLGRHPGRFAFSVLGIAFATSAIVLGRFANDAIGGFVEILFRHHQLEDVSVVLTEPRRASEVRSTLAAIPGVRQVEVQRVVPVRFSNGPASRDGIAIGHPPDPQLRRILDWPARPIPVPTDGVVLTDVLGRMLGVSVGDRVSVEARTGRHARGDLTVTALVREPVGLQGHLSLETLGRLLREPDQADEALLAVAPEDQAAVMAELARYPDVLGATRKEATKQQFDRQTGSHRTTFVAIASLFGGAMAVGIVYNNARIALSSRARELATLRVLGFTRGEVASVVVGELGAHVVLGVPLGAWMGRWMAAAMMTTVSEETWRFPTVVAPRTYAFAAVIVVASSALCAVLVRRQVDRLDLVGVLKTRE